jgi:hypothetical protein
VEYSETAKEKGIDLVAKAIKMCSIDMGNF